MTNEQKAKRLESWAQNEATFPRYSAKVAALLRESAALWREQDKAKWEPWSWRTEAALYRGHYIVAEDGSLPTWRVRRKSQRSKCAAFGYSDTLDAAKAAAVAWVDQQEGK